MRRHSGVQRLVAVGQRRRQPSGPGAERAKQAPGARVPAIGSPVHHREVLVIEREKMPVVAVWDHQRLGVEHELLAAGNSRRFSATARAATASARACRCSGGAGIYRRTAPVLNPNVRNRTPRLPTRAPRPARGMSTACSRAGTNDEP